MCTRHVCVYVVYTCVHGFLPFLHEKSRSLLVEPGAQASNSTQAEAGASRVWDQPGLESKNQSQKSHFWKSLLHHHTARFIYFLRAGNSDQVPLMIINLPYFTGVPHFSVTLRQAVRARETHLNTLSSSLFLSPLFNVVFSRVIQGRNKPVL